MKEELQKLIEQYGADAVAKAATEALNKHVPTINTPVVTDEQLINTISQLLLQIFWKPDVRTKKPIRIKQR